MVNDTGKWAEALGITAGILTTVAFIPEVYRVYRNNDDSGLSQAYLYIFLVGVLIWVAYGAIIRSWSVIIANSCTAILNILLIAKYYQLRRPKPKTSN